MTLSRPCGQQGFTLLEVLVALAILAVALAALIKVGSETASNAVYLRDRTHAHWTASNILSLYRTGERQPSASVERGSAFLAEREWFWETRAEKISPQVLGQQLEAIWRVRVAVYGDARRSGEPLAQLAAYLLP